MHCVNMKWAAIESKKCVSIVYMLMCYMKMTKTERKDM